MRIRSSRRAVIRTRTLVGSGLAFVLLFGRSTAGHADAEVEALAVAAGVVVASQLFAPNLEDPDHVAFEGGGLDAVKNAQPTAAIGLEYRFGKEILWRLCPFVGIGLTAERSVYGYGGIRLPAHWGDRFVVTPSFALGGYSRGNGKDLGNPPIIGRFGLDVEYRFESDVRLGVAYHHLSNGKIFGQSINPGTEVVGVTLSVTVR